MVGSGGMTYHYSVTGEPIEDEDDAMRALSDALLDLAAEYVPRSPDEIRQHCAELRRILRESRERRD
jgi:hypothetical protein